VEALAGFLTLDLSVLQNYFLFFSDFASFDSLLALSFEDRSFVLSLGESLLASFDSGFSELPLPAAAPLSAPDSFFPP
jgi:hypothetical protein